jgi:hypothetical protein
MALDEPHVTFFCVSENGGWVAMAELLDISTVRSIYTTRLSSANKLLGC